MGCANFAQHKVSCEIFAQAWISWLPKAISSSFQLQIVYGLKRWILDFLRFEMVYIACRKWTSGSAPKVRKKTAVAVLFASLHFACFSSLLLFACACFERLWQRAMELQSLVLHEFELPKYFP